jgi:hypothetical protein
VSHPAQVRLAWSVWAFCALLALLMVGLAIANFSISEPGAAFSALSLSVPMLAYPTVGALVISRAHNRIGWVFAATGVALALSWSGDAYANYALLERPGSLPGAVPFELVSNTGQVAGISMLGAVLLLFPSGKLPGAALAAGIVGPDRGRDGRGAVLRAAPGAVRRSLRVVSQSDRHPRRQRPG